MAKTRKFFCNFETKWRRNVIKFKTNYVELNFKIIFVENHKKDDYILAQKEDIDEG